jgi:hypothetical protein
MKTISGKILDNYKAENPFRVPENYFTQFNREIMTRLPERVVEFQEFQPQKVSMWSKVKPLLYMAAMLAGIYFSINLLTNNENFNILSIEQAEQKQSLVGSSVGSHWSSIKITEDEFFRFVEEQLTEFRYLEFLHYQFYMN